MKQVIVFVPDGTDGVGPETSSPQAGANVEKPCSAYERYVNERLQGPEYLCVLIGLRQIQFSLERIKGSWEGIERARTLAELEGLLVKQHELELQIEQITDTFVREYVFGQLDAVAQSRRYLAEEIRWDIGSIRARPP